MSLGIGVLAIDGWTDVAEVIAMVDRCEGPHHIEGELDPRIAAFYEALRASFPDHPPYVDSAQCPWMSMPLDIGIDHVFMLLSFSERSQPALELIQELATDHGLTIWNPQDRTAHRPVRGPSRENVASWWRDLLADLCSREQTYNRVRPWVEETPEALDDPITSMGVHQLYSLTIDGTDAGASFERWLDHGDRFDADPEGWHRDRLIASVQAVRRDQGLKRAQALALQLQATGSLSTQDVRSILGPAS